MAKQMLTIKRANEILRQYKPDATINRIDNDTLYHITYKKGERNYPFDSCMNLYDILVEVVGNVKEIEVYADYYRPNLPSFGKTAEELAKEDSDFFGF